MNHLDPTGFIPRLSYPGQPSIAWPRHRRAPKTHTRVLLLQGPAGPFFSSLQDYLNAEGIECQRVCLNGADRDFTGRKRRIDFSGGPAQWQGWLRACIAGGNYDALLGYGCFTPPHVAARAIAAEAGVPFLSLEEGYFGPGFISAEFGGNDAASPLAGRLPPPEFNADLRAASPAFASPGHLPPAAERNPSFIREPLLWAQNAIRSLQNGNRDIRPLDELLEDHGGRYFLVPLQSAGDVHASRPAQRRARNRLVSEALCAFARSAPDRFHLVFMVPPPEHRYAGPHPNVMEMASQLGIADRVQVLETGLPGLLTRGAAGVITNNSQWGLSAILQGVPLLVAGDALYRHPALATCALGTFDFDAFWCGGVVARPRLRQRYLAWIREEALVPGDFQTAEGISGACRGVLARLRTLRREEAQPASGTVGALARGIETINMNRLPPQTFARTGTALAPPPARDKRGTPSTSRWSSHSLPLHKNTLGGYR